MKVKFNGWNCRAVGKNYLGGHKAICLQDEIDGCFVATATANLHDVFLKEDEVLIKNYSENEGMTESLIQAGIIEKEPTGTIKSGHVDISSYKLTKEAIEKLW